MLIYNFSPPQKNIFPGIFFFTNGPSNLTSAQNGNSLKFTSGKITTSKFYFVLFRDNHIMIFLI